jgi:hypothetical protein
VSTEKVWDDMRSAIRWGAVAVALGVAVLPAVPAMATTDVTVAAVAEDVPDLQEFAVDPSEVDGPQLYTPPSEEDTAEIGALVTTMCEPGMGKWSWAGKKSPWKVTHASAYENFSGATITRTKTAARELTITASASATVGATLEANTVIAKLDATVSYSLALSGSHTKSSSETVSGKMKSGYVYVYYAGARKVTGQYTYSVCNSRGTAVVVKSRGKATSYGLKREGAVRCGSSPASSSLGYVAERDFC